ncbi:hypothetical protein BGZ97_004129 [Linnemannia gamsii]|uniref:FH2 domain-containing protein n=1 Tax=Linnemannia gamsii TaxID=64522 RepID=A0A9P6QSH8_9FUNG|nr:hypothetical protein BGZ97_004129 [Linnemannia gamsii]
MDLPISKSKKRQNRRRKLRESRRESGEEADEEEAGYSHTNDGESDTPNFSYDLSIPTITFKLNKASRRTRIDSFYPLYDSSCASSPPKTANNIQSNVASRPQSNKTTRNGSGRSQGAEVTSSVLPTGLPSFLPSSSAHSSDTDTSLQTVVPELHPGMKLMRDDSRMEQSDENNEQTSAPSSTTAISQTASTPERSRSFISTTPTMAGRMRPTAISFAGSIDTQLDPSVEGELLMTPPPSASLELMRPPSSGQSRVSLFTGLSSTGDDDKVTDETLASKINELSMALTPDISPVLFPNVVLGSPPVSIIEPDYIARSSMPLLPSSPMPSSFAPPTVAELASPMLLFPVSAAAQVPLPPSPLTVCDATLEDPIPRSPVDNSLKDVTAAAAAADTVPLPASPDTKTIAFAHVSPSLEEGMDSSLSGAVADEPHLHLPCPSSVPPAAATNGAAPTAPAPTPVVTPPVNNTSGFPSPPPPPPPPGPPGLKKNGPRTPLQISTSIMPTLDSHPPGHGPSLTAPLTPTRSIVARHVLRWDALSHGDISQTVFDTDHHHHHGRHRHHHHYHGHGRHNLSGHTRLASTVPNTPTSLKSPGFLSLEDSKGLDQYVMSDGGALDDAPPGSQESRHDYLHGQPEGPLDGPSGPHQECGPGPIAPPLAIEMDFQKFEEMFCIDPVEEQKRLKAKEANAQAKVKPKEVTLLEVRRATNVSIGLSRLMKRYESFDALRSMVLALDINPPTSPPPSSSTSSASTALSSQSTLPKSSSLHSLSSLSSGNHKRIVTSPAVVHSSTRNSPMVSRPTSSTFPSPSLTSDSPRMRSASTFTPPTSNHSQTMPPPLATSPPPSQPSLMSILTAHPLFASNSSMPPSPTLSTTVTNPSTGSFFSSRSETPVVYQRHLNLDDLLTLEPLLPNEKERKLLDVYQRQNKADFLVNETEAVQKLGVSERFMYAMSRPVFMPLPEPAVPSENLQWAKGPTSVLKGGFASLNLKGLGKSGALAALSAQSGGSGGLASASRSAASAVAEEEPLLIDDYIFAAICMLRFDADLTSTETQIRELVEGCDALRMNENLKVLFLGVLKVGNMLNTIYGRKKPSWQMQTHMLSSAHPASAPVRTLHPAKSMPNMNVSMKIGSGQGAAGFRLNSLLKLRDVRSLDNKSNLMHYLANMVANNNPELLNLPEQFAFLSKLEQYRTKEILDQVVDHQKAIRKLRAFKEKLERRVEAMEEAASKLVSLKSIVTTGLDGGSDVEEGGEEERNAEEERVRKEQAEEQEQEIQNGRQVLGKLEKFLTDAQSRFDDLVDQVELLDRSWRATAIYFGEKSAEDIDNPFTSSAATSNITQPLQQLHQQQQQMVNRMLTGPRKPPEEIFAVLHEFFRHFREAHLQNEDQVIKQRRQAASYARRSKNSSTSSTSTTSTATSTTKSDKTPAGSSKSTTSSLSGLVSRSAIAGL